MQVWVSSGSYAREALEECVGGSVEELVGDAEDAAFVHSLQALPVALSDDAFERDAIPCTTPGEEENVGVGGRDFFGGGVGAGSA